MKKGTGRNRGISLVEILATIAILVILAALLFPSAKGFLAGGQSAGCAANLRKIGGAMRQYTVDNAGHFPPHWGGANDSRWRDTRAFQTAYSGSVTWYGFLAPYLSDWNGDIMQPMNKVFACPAVPVSSWKGKTYASTAANGGQSYGYNYYNLTHNFASQQIVRAAGIQRPSKLVLVADIPAAGGEAFPLPSYMANYLLYPGAPALAGRHPGKIGNVLFADGHVESVDARAFVSPGESFSLQNWDATR